MKPGEGIAATLLGIVLISHFASVDYETTQRKLAEQSAQMQREYDSVIENLSAKRISTNGIEYLSIPIKEKEVRLYGYRGSYLPIKKIRQLELQHELENSHKATESNLITIIGDETK